MAAVPLLRLMSRKGCCLCEDAEAAAAEFVRQGACRLDVVDVDGDLQLALLYGADVPVLLIGGEVRLRHHIDRGQLQTLLAALQEG